MRFTEDHSLPRCSPIGKYFTLLKVIKKERKKETSINLICKQSKTKQQDSTLAEFMKIVKLKTITLKIACLTENHNYKENVTRKSPDDGLNSVSEIQYQL